jgi:hypothetical protein
MSSKKRGCYLTHRRRTLRGIFLETAQDGFFNDGINVFYH